MKITKIKQTLFLALAFFLGTSAYAQRGPGNGQMRCESIPDLTEEQQTQIEDLRIEHWKKMQDYRNQIRENRARYITLTTSQQPDQKAINKNIDEWTGLKGEMMKEKTSHGLAIRSLLNDEQKMWFDKNAMSHGKGKGHCMGAGMGSGRGFGPGQGKGYHGKNCPSKN